MEEEITGTRIVMIEDEVDAAQGYVRHCRINELMDNVAYITDFNNLADHFLDKKMVQVFWVDLNLGTGREEEGFDIIKIIKDRCPEALVIVHTAYDETEERCRKEGADHFFVKGPNYEETMDKINKIIKEFLHQNGYKIDIIEYSAVIAEIRDTWVKLECNYNGNEIVRTFPVGPIKEALGDELALDKVVKIKVIHKQNEIKIIFEKDEESDLGATPDLADLRNSDIWSNKLS